MTRGCRSVLAIALLLLSGCAYRFVGAGLACDAQAVVMAEQVEPGIVATLERDINLELKRSRTQIHLFEVRVRDGNSEPVVRLDAGRQLVREWVRVSVDWQTNKSAEFAEYGEWVSTSSLSDNERKRRTAALAAAELLAKKIARSAMSEPGVCQPASVVQ